MKTRARARARAHTHTHTHTHTHKIIAFVHTMKATWFYCSYMKRGSIQELEEYGWSNLPAETLLLVFSHLPVQDLGRVAQVCQRWNLVAQFPHLWQKAEFNLIQASE